MTTPDNRRARLVGMVQRGECTIPEAAEIVGCARSTAFRWLSESKAAPLPADDAPPSLDAARDKAIARLVRLVDDPSAPRSVQLKAAEAIIARTSPPAAADVEMDDDEAIAMLAASYRGLPQVLRDRLRAVLDEVDGEWRARI